MCHLANGDTTLKFPEDTAIHMSKIMYRVNWLDLPWSRSIGILWIQSNLPSSSIAPFGVIYCQLWFLRQHPCDYQVKHFGKYSLVRMRAFPKLKTFFLNREHLRSMAEIFPLCYNLNPWCLHGVVEKMPWVMTYVLFVLWRVPRNSKTYH